MPIPEAELEFRLIRPTGLEATIGEILAALEASPETETFVICPRDYVVDSHAQMALAHALQFEKVFAVTLIPAEQRHSDFEALNFPGQVITHPTLGLCAFDGQLARTLLPEALDEFGTKLRFSEFCIFVNRFGFSTVAMNIPGIELPPNWRDAQPLPHRREWSEYVSHSGQYLDRHEVDFSFKFRNLQFGSNSPKVLLDAGNLPNIINGTSRLVISFLRYVEAQCRLGNLDWSVEVLAPEYCKRMFEDSGVALPFITTTDGKTGPYDVCVTLTPITSLKRCVDLSRQAARWVVLHFDVIAIRAFTHRSQQMWSRSALEFAREYADEFIAISASALKDVENLFGKGLGTEGKVCLLGLPDEFIDAQITNAFGEFSDAILVAGNDDPHKLTLPTVRALLTSGKRVVSISQRNQSSDQDVIFRPGQLSDSELKSLMATVSMVVFPSIYEGFGLPLLEAASVNSRVFAWKTAVSEEVRREFSLENVTLISSLDELVRASDSTRPTTADIPKHLRRMSEFGRDLAQIVTTAAAETQPSVRAIERYGLANYISEAIEEQQSKSALSQPNSPVSERRRAKLFLAVLRRFKRVLARKND